MKSLTRSRKRRLSNTPLRTVSSSGDALRRQIVARHRAPGHEPLAVGGQRADTRREPVRNHQRRVGAEQRADLRLVGLQLVEGAVERGVLVAGVLEFDHAKRQAVDEDHDVGPAVRLVLDHGELVDRQPVIGVGVVEVDKPDLLAADGAVHRGVTSTGTPSIM